MNELIHSFIHGWDERYLGFSEIKVHAVVDDGDGLEVEVAHAVDLQLKGQCWLQVSVDAVFCELVVVVVVVVVVVMLVVAVVVVMVVAIEAYDGW